MFKVDVAGNRQVAATVALLKVAPRRIRTYMTRAARQAITALWRPAVQAHASTKMARRVILTGTRGVVGSETFHLVAANGRRALSGGLEPRDQWHGVEFGAVPQEVKVTIQGHSRSQVINRQFGPRVAKGRVAYRAARDVGPQVVAAWTEAAVAGAVHGTALETKGGA